MLNIDLLNSKFAMNLKSSSSIKNIASKGDLQPMHQAVAAWNCGMWEEEKKKKVQGLIR